MAGKYETYVKPKLKEIEQWIEEGKTEKSICESLGITQKAFIDYKKEYGELSEAIKRGNDFVDNLVENALLKRAKGFEYEEKTTEYGADGNPISAKLVKKYIVPDVGAIAFWLKNRKPDIWKERQEIGITKGLDEIRDAYLDTAKIIKEG